MARSRNVKPALFKNEILGEADPLLTILFIGLWCLADREGRIEDRPKRIKAEIFPYRELPDFNGYLTVLRQLGFIDRYEVGKTAIIQIVNFHKHQSPHKTEKPSELPENTNKTTDCKITDKQPLDNESPTVKESLIPDSLSTDSLEEKAPPKKCTSPEIEIPDWIDSDIWKDFEAHRKEIGAKLKPTATRRLLQKLEKYQQLGADPNAALLASVENQWRGVFPEKLLEDRNVRGNGASKTVVRETAAERRDRVAREGIEAAEFI